MSNFLFSGFSITTKHSRPINKLITSNSSLNLGINLTQTRNLNLFAEFAKSVKRQYEENKQLKENIKQLSDESNRIQQSEAMIRAKKAMEKTSKGTSKVVDGIKFGASKVGEAYESTMETEAAKKTIEITKKVGEKVSEGVHYVADPILETEAAKKVSSGLKSVKEEVIDTQTTHRYIEYAPKEERKKKLQDRLTSTDPLKRIVQANPEAGQNIVIHKETKMNQRWADFKENNILFQNLLKVQKTVEESENPILERFRDWFSGMGEESEEAQVVKAFRMCDPSFSLDSFLRDATQFYIPDIMEAYLKGDEPVLKMWCSEQLYAQLMAGITSQKTQGLISDSKLLDIRKVELLQTKILENDIPILLLEFNTQEILLFKNLKGEIVLGNEDNIEHARYRMVFTKDQIIDATAEINPETFGWRVLESVKI
ncbi:protein translocase subunit, partial [Clydaea vesicula]